MVPRNSIEWTGPLTFELHGIVSCCEGKDQTKIGLRSHVCQNGVFGMGIGTAGTAVFRSSRVLVANGALAGPAKHWGVEPRTEGC